MKDHTQIVAIIDESGSMGSCLKGTLDGFNEYMQEQKKIGNNASVTLTTFSTSIKELYVDRPINTVADLSTAEYYPNGGTALFDALGKTITTVGATLAALKEEDRPKNVVFIVITDGEENASKEYTREKVKEMIDHQQTKYSWDFVFLGANIDVKEAATNLGFSKFAGYTSDVLGTKSAFKSMSMYCADVRSVGGANASMDAFNNLTDNTSN